MFSNSSEESVQDNSRPVKKERLWNILTLLALLITLAAAVFMLVIFNNPKTVINPFPPPVMPEKLILPTSTGTATITTEPTATPTISNSPEPTATGIIEPSSTTEVVVVPGTPSAISTPDPTNEPENSSRFPFGLQADPQGLSVNLYDPTRSCSWMGVAGRIFDIQNRPVKGIRVALTGYLSGKRIELLSLSGTALQYGPSGYEFTLADKPIASLGRLTIQLFDQSDLPLSPPVLFDTFADCETNLILIDFKQVNE